MIKLRIVLIVLALILFDQLPASAADMDCWVLTQNGPRSQGTFYISQNGIKCGPDPTGISMVAKAPDWILYAYNPKKKLYTVQAPAVWKSAYEKVVPGLYSAIGHQSASQKGADTEIAGVRTTQYYSDGTAVYVAETPKLSKLATELLHFLMGISLKVPDEQCVLLRLDIRQGKDKVLNLVDTVSYKQEAVPASTFDLPAGYQVSDTLY